MRQGSRPLKQYGQGENFLLALMFVLSSLLGGTEALGLQGSIVLTQEPSEDALVRILMEDTFFTDPSEGDINDFAIRQIAPLQVVGLSFELLEYASGSYVADWDWDSTLCNPSPSCAPLNPMDTGSIIFTNSSGAFFHIGDTSATFGNPTFTTSMTVQQFVDAVDANTQIQAGDGGSNFIDSTGWTASFVAIPEPSSFTLLALASLGAMRRRQR